MKQLSQNITADQLGLAGELMVDSTSGTRSLRQACLGGKMTRPTGRLGRWLWLGLGWHGFWLGFRFSCSRGHNCYTNMVGVIQLFCLCCHRISHHKVPCFALELQHLLGQCLPLRQGLVFVLNCLTLKTNL